MSHRGASPCIVLINMQQKTGRGGQKKSNSARVPGHYGKEKVKALFSVMVASPHEEALSRRFSFDLPL